MADEFDGQGDPRYVALYRGVVTAIDDPLKIGRVRVRVPGLLEPDSNWALPLNVGGGSGALGVYFVPEVGSDVAVWFHQGDVDELHYLPGCFRAPGRTSALNSRITQKTASDAPSVKVIETDRWVVVLDDSATTPGLVLEDKVSGDGIELNGLTRAMSISATSSISIRAVGSVSIEGVNVTINGRPVAPSPEPI